VPNDFVITVSLAVEDKPFLHKLQLVHQEHQENAD
jgi:hypothetical protein